MWGFQCSSLNLPKSYRCFTFKLKPHIKPFGLVGFLIFNVFLLFCNGYNHYIIKNIFERFSMIFCIPFEVFVCGEWGILGFWLYLSFDFCLFITKKTEFCIIHEIFDFFLCSVSSVDNFKSCYYWMNFSAISWMPRLFVFLSYVEDFVIHTHSDSACESWNISDWLKNFRDIVIIVWSRNVLTGLMWLYVFSQPLFVHRNTYIGCNIYSRAFVKWFFYFCSFCLVFLDF